MSSTTAETQADAPQVWQPGSTAPAPATPAEVRALQSSAPAADQPVVMPQVGDTIVLPNTDGRQGTLLRVHPHPTAATPAGESTRRVTVTVAPHDGGPTHRSAVPAWRLDARLSVTQAATAASLALARTYLALEREYQQSIERHREYLDGLIHRAHEYADEADLCEQFDNFMAQEGFPRRTMEVQGEIEVHVTLTVRYEETIGRGEDMWEEFQEGDLVDALDTLLGDTDLDDTGCIVAHRISVGETSPQEHR